jgi:hypothetical protein
MIALETIHGLTSARPHRLVVAPTSDTMLMVAETVMLGEPQYLTKEAT